MIKSLLVLFPILVFTSSISGSSSREKNSDIVNLKIVYDTLLHLEIVDTFSIDFIAIRRDGKEFTLQRSGWWNKKWKDFDISIQGGRLDNRLISINRSDASKNDHSIKIHIESKFSPPVKTEFKIPIPYIAKFDFLYNQFQKCKLEEPLAAKLYVIYNTGERYDAFEESFNQIRFNCTSSEITQWGLIPKFFFGKFPKEISISAKTITDSAVKN